jgi:thiol-disulfide isomerase/thioredoxin
LKHAPVGFALRWFYSYDGLRTTFLDTFVHSFNWTKRFDKHDEDVVMKKFLRFAVISTISILVSGCGLTSSSYPPFKVLLDVQKVTPSPSFDAQVVDAQLYSHVQVYTEDGKRVVLDAKQHPLLFVAYWCPHCQRTLVDLEKNQHQLKELPFVINMGFGPGASLAKAKLIEHQEMQALGLQSMKFYYVVNDPKEQRYIPNGFPTLVFSRGDQLLSLYGEHQFDVWQRAINQSSATGIG